MKNQKGFTLVELLAVIVILAVVILIAVTAVIPRMNDARKGAFADEVMAYIRGAEEAYVETQMDGSAGETCFTVAWLNANKIDKKESGYTGYVQMDTTANSATYGKFLAYIQNSKYKVNGLTGALSKDSVSDASGTISIPNTCKNS